jgi:hypothetical protein
MINSILFLLLGIASAQTPTPLQAPQAATGRIEGILYERGTKTPLPDVNIFLLPMKLKATTDTRGHFVFENLPAGEVDFVVNAAGFNRLDLADTVEAETSGRPRKLYLERITYNALGTTVTGRLQKRDDTTRAMTREQFLTMPGSDGDPVKAIQNLPGIARPVAGSAQVVIQGSAPEDTSYLLDDHDVPLVFHFGGMTSVITPEAVDQVDYLSAGYGPEFGRAMGGVINLHTKNPATDRKKGFIFVDTTKTGAMIEGPIDDKSSYWLTGRYSYFGLVIQHLLKDNDKLDLTVAPNYYDLSGLYKNHLGAQDDLRILSIYSHDQVQFLFKEPLNVDPGIRGAFQDETSFWRVLPQWTHQFSEKTKARLSVGAGQDRQLINVGDDYLDIKAKVLTQRGEIEDKITPAWTSILGLDNNIQFYDVRVRIPNPYMGGGVNNPIATGQTQDATVTRTDFFSGTYWRNTLHEKDSPWTLMPSLRLDYFTRTHEVLPAPRIATRYDIDDSLFARAATGLYYQPPQPQEADSAIGNPGIKSPHAWHFATGFEKDFRHGTGRGYVVSPGLFYRKFSQLIIPDVESVYSNKGVGEAYGAELLVRLDAKPWSGFIAYTLSRSTRQEPGQDVHPFQYDQTHNLNVVGQVELKGNWLIATRMQYVTGNPSTPVVGATFDSDNDVYIPQRGPFYSSRLAPFFQLDVRFDKKWILNENIISAYLDIENITNSKNPEAIRYSYDYSQSQTVTGLPVLPTLGVRGEF